jgi:hypothetical protein
MSNASQRPQRPVVKKGTDPVVRILFWLLVVVGVAGFLEFKGPYKGWLTARLAPEEPIEEPAAPAPEEPQEVVGKPVEPAPVVAKPEPTEPELPEKPPKSEMEMLYDKLYAKYLQKFKPPQKGAALKLKLRSGDTVTGTLEEVTPGRLKVRMKFGTMTYPLHVVHPSMYPYIFPEREARNRAMKELDQIIAKRQADQEALVTAEADARRKKQAEYDRAQRQAEKERQRREREKQLAAAPTPPPVNFTEPKAGPFRYDTSDGKTPSHLSKTVQAFGMRLRYQQRAMGAPIAKKIFAKQQEDKVVLYMEMSKTYQVQDYDVRFAVADQLWNIWSMRCREGGKVRNSDGAHLVLIDETGKQIGGSTEKAASDIWVKQKGSRG